MTVHDMAWPTTPLLPIGKKSQTIIDRISILDKEIQSRQIRLEQLREGRCSYSSSIGHGIFQLPPSLPSPIPPPTTVVVKHVRNVLQARIQEWRSMPLPVPIRKTVQKLKPRYSKRGRPPLVKELQSSKRSNLVKEKCLEDNDLLLVADLHGIRPGSPKAGRKLRAIRRRVNKDQNRCRNDNEVKTKRAPVPRVVSCSSNATNMVGCMSVRIQDAVHHVEMSNIINPWTACEKFLFLKLYLEHGRDFPRISEQMSYKSVADCVRLYYTQKLQLGLKGLRERASSGEVIPDNALLPLAGKGIMSRNLRHGLE